MNDKVESLSSDIETSEALSDIIQIPPDRQGQQESIYHGIHGNIYFEVETPDSKKKYQKFTETTSYTLYIEGDEVTPEKWRISITGITHSDRIVSELIPLKRYKKPISIRLEFADTLLGGICKITDLNISVPADSVVDFTLYLEGVEELVVSSLNEDIDMSSIVDNLKDYSL